MKQRMILVTIAAVVLGVTGALAPGMAQEKAKGTPDTKTLVQGEVLDLSCYVAHDGVGEGHAGCAAKCLKGGAPMGLLASDGVVYILFADHTDAAPYEKTKGYAGKKVEITGDVAAKDGLKGITVHGVKAL